MACETTEQIKHLKELVRNTYEGLGYDLHPLKTYVLVRVIPKQQEKELTRFDGRKVILETPDKQNKPNWEGQVLRVFKPRKEYEVRFTDCSNCGNRANGTKVKTIESELNEGDHVLFPHWAIVPVPELNFYWKNGDYGLVEEKAVFAVCEYTEASDEEKLKDYLQKYIKDRFTLERATRDLMSKATVIFGRDAKTTSGK